MNLSIARATRIRPARRLASLLFRLACAVLVAALPAPGGFRAAAQEIEVLAGDVPRHALVIGNQDYQGDTRDLANAAGDAALIGDTLEGLGFVVTRVENATQIELSQALLGFARGLPKGGIVLVFFAGHGVQWQGENYFIPVDADPEELSDLRLISLSASNLLTLLAERDSLANIFIFDACRNNPFAKAANRTFGGQTEIRGLAPTRIRFTGNLVAYSTAPGEVSSDGRPGEHSPYAWALSQALARPGLGIESVFKLTRSLVIGATGHAQIPWENSSLTRDIFLLPEAETPEALRPTECDIAAGHPSDPDRVTPGIDYALLRPAIAIPACRASLNRDPENARLMTLLARALLKAGQYEEALALNHRAAETGYTGAFHNIGNHYKQGSGVERNMDTALEWFLKAAERGHPEDAYNAGVIYLTGTDTMPPDLERARLWLERSAAQDYPSAFDRLGILYRDGLGVPADPARANENFEEGAQLGDASAMVNLGTAYLKGQGVETDYAHAYDLFRRAAQLRRRSAYTNLGDMYRRGQGRETDMEEAAFWYGLAAFQGHAYSLEQFNAALAGFDEAKREAINERIQQWIHADFG
ncbi:caspase family protein [Poseidonocella sp. HB161398]|uniref:caspase family protein n=1 Tax=Poseidonocella sp. HB161398 TaxID=2320855 RepID=UPI0014863957|nr:caspase family protein [Poseidonocella sp. HB161398]